MDQKKNQVPLKILRISTVYFSLSKKILSKVQSFPIFKSIFKKLLYFYYTFIQLSFLTVQEDSEKGPFLGIYVKANINVMCLLRKIVFYNKNKDGGDLQCISKCHRIGDI